jgi:hypothetical protein
MRKDQAGMPLSSISSFIQAFVATASLYLVWLFEEIDLMGSSGFDGVITQRQVGQKFVGSLFRGIECREMLHRLKEQVAWKKKGNIWWGHSECSLSLTLHQSILPAASGQYTFDGKHGDMAMPRDKRVVKKKIDPPPPKKKKKKKKRRS